MIAYHVGPDSARTVRYDNQADLMALVDQWRLPRILHYAAHGLRCVIYCPPMNETPVCVCLVILHATRPISAALLQELFRWAAEHHRTLAYEPLRETTHGVASTPNAGTQRTVRDLRDWCDESTDALTHHFVLMCHKTAALR